MGILFAVNRLQEADLDDVMFWFDELQGRKYDTVFVDDSSDKTWLVVYEGDIPSTKDLEEHLRG